MPSFQEGSLVQDRSTKLLCKVVRWDKEAGLLLLTPSNRSNVGQCNDKIPTGRKRPRTRWAFEHMVEPVPSSATQTPPEDPSARNNVGDNPTPYAQRVAQLDRRVEIRRTAKRGRGLFALRNVPAGEEVMRVSAAAAISIDWKRVCSGCLLSTETVGPLEACHGCCLCFCAGCKKAGTGGGVTGAGVVAVHSSSMCELTRELFRIFVHSRAGADKAQGNLRLLADVLARRKAGVIDDDEWNLIISLESHDNKANSFNLEPRELESCARLLKRFVGIDVSEAEVQSMYRRIVRNVHVVSPNSRILEDASVEGLFPCASLVNHSCIPNTFFHCVAEPSPAGNGPQAIKHVLRTVCDVKAGDELCYSYLASCAALGSVEERRRSLHGGWGFRCACKRCEDEAAEDGRLQGARTRVDEVAMRIIADLERIAHLAQRGNAPSPKEETYAPLLQSAARFYKQVEGNRLSPVLQRRLALALFDATEVTKVSSPTLHFAAIGLAADELSKMRNPMEISCLKRQFNITTEIQAHDLPESDATALFQSAGRHRLLEAQRLERLFYGR